MDLKQLLYFSVLLEGWESKHEKIQQLELLGACAGGTSVSLQVHRQKRRQDSAVMAVKVSRYL